MKLKDLLKGVEVSTAHIDLETEIGSISYDTRQTQPGGLFAALRGAVRDGHEFISAALEKGAAAILCETPPHEEGPWVVVPDARLALALVSANWFGHPAEKMTLIAVTGTNGKTTTTTLLKNLLEECLGTPVGLIGTNRNMVGSLELEAHRTTPESYELQALFRRMADAGCTHVVMEVSSHALVQHRTAGLRFAQAIFTNLTQDHLDYHGTMEAYREAKALLFRQADLAILNLDDETGRLYKQQVSIPAFTYAVHRQEADLTAENPKLFPDHIQFEALAPCGLGRAILHIPGKFSVYNALAVIASAIQLGIPLPRALEALSHAKGVKGRMEVVSTPAAYTVILDYSHTPDALENALTSLRPFTTGRLLCLVGCGGNRDKTKRPIMGEIAGKLADLTFLTSDNPRNEEPEAILADMLPGMERSGGKYRLIPDRKEAIRAALAEGKEGDVLLFAGKGHETYQEVKGQILPLDEREEIAAYFQK